MEVNRLLRLNIIYLLVWHDSLAYTHWLTGHIIKMIIIDFQVQLSVSLFMTAINRIVNAQIPIKCNSSILSHRGRR